MLNKVILVLACAFSLISMHTAFASETNHLIIAPLCLLKNVNQHYQVIAQQNLLILIKIPSAEIDKLAIAKNRTTLCSGFIDVTEAWQKNPSSDVKKKARALFNSHMPKPIFKANKVRSLQHKKEVNQLLMLMNPQSMWHDLTTLTSYKDRYANSETGLKAAEWIKNTVETMAKSHGRQDITAYFVKTGNYKQPSVVVKFGSSNEPGIVIGAHMDTLNGKYSKKPGADDDGSGSVTVLATARTILESGMTFKKPIYFVWYAAEELGLIGSGKVVSDFATKKIPVDAVLHYDMTGYAYRNESTMWLIDDYVDTNLVKFLEKLINTYIKVPVKHTKCGYACSDHYSWTQQGYSSAIPAEASFENTNPDMHSTWDTMENLSLNHMTNYLKLALAFAAESAEPVNHSN